MQSSTKTLLSTLALASLGEARCIAKTPTFIGEEIGLVFSNIDQRYGNEYLDYDERTVYADFGVELELDDYSLRFVRTCVHDDGQSV